MQLITLKTFDNPYEAHLLRSRLESEGIESYVFDEHMMTLNPIFNVSMGGIKVKIKKENQEEARKIIKDIENTLITDENDEIVKCPACKSTQYYTGVKSMKGFVGFFLALFSFTFAIFPIYFKTIKKCKVCGNEFN